MCGRWLLATNLALVAMAQLPPDAVVIERAPVRVDRELVLWMVKPERFDRGPNTKDNPYMCPERTRGHHYIGPTRVSLVDSATRTVLNTVSIHPYKEDSFDVPYRIVPDYYYRVPGAKAGEEGKPKLLDLRDFNGDGMALEAAFFEAQGCMGLLTTLVGYSHKQDRVIQYEAELDHQEKDIVEGSGYRERGKPHRVRMNWIDYLLTYKPVSPGRWSYKVDYTGRGGTLSIYEIRYDRAAERFRGTLTEIIPPWYDRP